MSQVARDYLSIPPEKVDVERIFSSKRDLLGIRRHSLGPETMRAVMFYGTSISDTILEISSLI
jgi:hypothetical protein